jgi:hypothetical protein
MLNSSTTRRLGRQCVGRIPAYPKAPCGTAARVSGINEFERVPIRFAISANRKSRFDLHALAGKCELRGVGYVAQWI